MKRRRFLQAMAAAVALGAAACDREPAPRLLVLGLDGMDPDILARLTAEGRMPHLQALAARGGFSRLATTAPPQSPVAWSTFITGLPPAQHGIFDFVHRDPESLSPYLSTSRRDRDGNMALQRHGTPFWDVLVDHGVSVTIYKVPGNFPPSTPAHLSGCQCRYRAFAGMGTPDILGSYGTFTLYTNGPYSVPEYLDAAGDTLAPGGRIDIPGGRIVSLDLGDGSASLSIAGPEIEGTDRHAGAELVVDVSGRAVQIDLADDQRLILGPGEWSSWVQVDYGRRPGSLSHVTGIARFYLASTDPLRLYLSPVNIDPADPLMPVSSPPDEAARLAAAQGPYYTQGMPADTKALEAQVLDYGEFLTQLAHTVDERRDHLQHELSQFEEGVLFFYVHSLDQLCHALWRTTSPTHPGYRPELARYAGAIDDHYEQLDRLVGAAVAQVGTDCEVLVMSDHGFAPFERAVNLNTWLVAEGFLILRNSAPADGLNLLGQGNVRWEESSAYALGLNGLYLNLQGREQFGAVAPEQVDGLLQAIEDRLLAWRDPVRGTRVVSKVYRVGQQATGFEEVAPDLLVGYARGYRSSGASAIGTLEAGVLTDNLSPWSGDHCMAAEEVPGILVASRPIALDDPGLADIPVTILDHYGLEPPPEMTGRPVWDTTSRP